MNRLAPLPGSRYSYRGRKLEVQAQRRGDDSKWHITFRWEDTGDVEERAASWFRNCVGLPRRPR